MAIDTQTSPLVILTIDAGDRDLIERWMQEGRLPAIADIVKRGCWGRITGSEQISPHGSWVSSFSGISRSQHGYYFLRQLQPKTYDVQTFSSRDAEALPFWTYLHGRDKKVAIIDAPEVYPSIQIGNSATPQPKKLSNAAFASPVQLLRDAREILAPQNRPFSFQLNRNLQEDRRVYRRLLSQVEKKGQLCRELLSRDRFDLAIAGFFECHQAAHRFWDYRPESQITDTGLVDNELAHAIENIYKATDRQLGLLLAQLPEKANVFICSVNGMKDGYPTFGLIESFCRQLGYQASPDSAPPSLSLLALIRRTLPENWRIAINHRLPKNVQERLLTNQFRSSTNWQKTIAFGIPSPFTGCIRVNLRGREPQGIVEPGAEYQALLDRLESDLKQLIDPQTGELAVQEVSQTVKLFQCDPPASLPDLFVEWKPTPYLMLKLLHPKVELTQSKPRYLRSSAHSNNGFFMAAGPSIQRRGAIEDISLLDLAPTFLSLMGEPIPHGMNGQVVEGIIHS